MVRQTISIFLLCVIVFDAGGLLFGLQIRQWIHKISIAVIMDTGDLPTEIVTMRMKRSIFDNIKIHEREFRLNNEMYDVVWRETEGDEYIIYCFRDAAEEKMIAKLLRFLANGTNENASSAPIMTNSISIGFYLSLPEFGYNAAPLSELERLQYFHPQHAINRSKRVEFPPPRISMV